MLNAASEIMPEDELAPPGEPQDAPEDGATEIVLAVHPDGSFSIGEDVFDSLEDALKGVIASYRSLAPEGATPNEQMAAGYGATDAPI